MHMTKISYLAMFMNSGVKAGNGEDRSEPPIPTAHDREVQFKTQIADPCRVEAANYRAFYTDATDDSGEPVLNIGYDHGHGVQPPPDSMGEPNIFAMTFLEPTDNHGFYPIGHAA